MYDVDDDDDDINPLPWMSWSFDGVISVKRWKWFEYNFTICLFFSVFALMIRIAHKKKGVQMPITIDRTVAHGHGSSIITQQAYMDSSPWCRIRSSLFTIIYQKYWRHSISCSNKLKSWNKRKLNIRSMTATHSDWAKWKYCLRKW